MDCPRNKFRQIGYLECNALDRSFALAMSRIFHRPRLKRWIISTWCTWILFPPFMPVFAFSNAVTQSRKKAPVILRPRPTRPNYLPPQSTLLAAPVNNSISRDDRFASMS